MGRAAKWKVGSAGLLVTVITANDNDVDRGVKGSKLLSLRAPVFWRDHNNSVPTNRGLFANGYLLLTNASRLIRKHGRPSQDPQISMALVTPS
jgi:hypothetical protein